MPREGSSDSQFRQEGDRPEDRTSYLRWLRESFDVDVNERLEARYDAVVNKVKRDFEGAPFWKQIETELKDYDSEYRLQAQNYPLFLASDEAPVLVTKSFDSYLLKTYRRNVAENGAWPDPPKAGWILPDEGFSRLSDLVRTSFVVKYLDGVEFLSRRLKENGESLGCTCQLDFEAKMEGHYAAHLCVRDTFQVPDESWEMEEVSISVEIQIITQLQEVIRRLTHKFYEARREQPSQARSNWQWDYKSDEFTANYLGHILHYVEGMIMEVRTRQNDTKGEMAWSDQI